MKPIDIDPIIKAIEARQENAEDLPPLTTGDFLRMLREASEPKTDGIQLIIREDGTAEKYDDTYDLTIHCTSEDEQKEVLKIMNQAAKLRQLKQHGDLIDREVLNESIKELRKIKPLYKLNEFWELEGTEIVNLIMGSPIVIEGSEDE
jgi:hypothetical protein